MTLLNISAQTTQKDRRVPIFITISLMVIFGQRGFSTDSSATNVSSESKTIKIKIQASNRLTITIWGQLITTITRIRPPNVKRCSASRSKTTSCSTKKRSKESADIKIRPSARKQTIRKGLKGSRGGRSPISPAEKLTKTLTLYQNRFPQLTRTMALLLQQRSELKLT